VSCGESPHSAIRRRLRAFLFLGRLESRAVTISLSGVMYLVAVILFILAAIPPTEPHRGRLMSVGLAFFAGGHLL
jgi:hypothetical protein